VASTSDPKEIDGSLDAAALEVRRPSRYEYSRDVEAPNAAYSLISSRRCLQFRERSALDGCDCSVPQAVIAVHGVVDLWND